MAVDAEANAVADTAGPGRAALGQLLVRGGHISPVQLDQALEEGSKTGERLGEVVVKRGWVTEDDVARLLAEQWGLSYVDRASIWFDANALARLSREDAQRLEALPTRIEDGRVVAAVAEPTEHRLEALRKLLGDETVVIVVPKSALEAGLRSELLPSRGSSGDEAGNDDADGDDGLEPAAKADDESESGDEAAAPKKLRAVAPLPEQDPEGDSSVDSVMALAAQARGIADMLAEQAASIRTEAARADTAAAEKLSTYETQIEELGSQVVELEARVEGLEAELVSRQEAMDATAEKLEEMLSLLRVPEPAETA